MMSHFYKYSLVNDFSTKLGILNRLFFLRNVVYILYRQTQIKAAPCPNVLDHHHHRRSMSVDTRRRSPEVGLAQRAWTETVAGSATT